MENAHKAQNQAKGKRPLKAAVVEPTPAVEPVTSVESSTVVVETVSMPAVEPVSVPSESEVQTNEPPVQTAPPMDAIEEIATEELELTGEQSFTDNDAVKLGKNYNRWVENYNNRVKELKKCPQKWIIHLLSGISKRVQDYAEETENWGEYKQISDNLVNAKYDIERALSILKVIPNDWVAPAKKQKSTGKIEVGAWIKIRDSKASEYKEMEIETAEFYLIAEVLKNKVKVVRNESGVKFFPTADIYRVDPPAPSVKP